MGEIWWSRRGHCSRWVPRAASLGGPREKTQVALTLNASLGYHAA